MVHPRLSCILLLIAPILPALVSAGGAEPIADPDDPIDFVRDIQPIFEAHCLKCHGPEKRRGGLLLSNHRDAFFPAESGQVVIVRGQPEKSVLVHRITTDDAEERMPPKGKPLAGPQIALLRGWIARGAVWPDDGSTKPHWAYVKPKRPAPPQVRNADWSRNLIDDFVLSRLEAEGLSPAPPAEKERLLRRVSLALTGLPPTLKQVDDFVADPSPKAYELTVDRLLSSDRYGERWARPWLDLARYADSNGFQADQLRDSWPYRDWVIQAMNADMPFDQFTVEQLAGDLLPNATDAQRIATGFHRTVTCNVEAGVHPEENRVNQVFDRVNTTGTVFLGTTLECAQCHNHKYDPFSTRDYYQIFAYFNNTPVEVKNPSGKGVSFNFYGPKMDLPLTEEQQEQHNALTARYQRLEQQRQRDSQRDAAHRRQWESDLAASVRTAPTWHVLEIDSFTSTGGEGHKRLEDGSILVGGSVPDTTVYTLTVRTDLAKMTAFRLEALTHPSLPGKGPGRGDAKRTNFILSDFSVRAVAGTSPEASEEVELHSPRADFSQSRWEVAKAIDGDRRTGWAISPQFQKPHWAVFETARPVGGPGGTHLTFVLDQNYGRGRTLGCVRLSALTGDPGALDVPTDVSKILAKSAGQRSRKEIKRLDDLYAATRRGSKKLDIEMQRIKKQLGQIKPPSALVMVEMDKPRPTHILRRGEYLQKGPPVTSAAPATLHPLDPKLPNNRLGLARWLVDANNPLIGRVTVNRWWSQLMGRGLVTTPEDLGTQGEPPTHPRLLDWLAVEFVEGGWSRKHIHKLIVMSATFRQSARIRSADLLRRDPENALYTRGPRFRMSAEMVRDNALAISGLLTVGSSGPPVMPYQPAGIWRQVGRNEPKWVEARGEDRFRRGVYVVWRRAAPYPSFVNFDGPDRSACVVQRGRTNTPLQALTLLNDPAYLEAALALAGRILAERPSATIRERAEYGFRLTLARRPSKTELDHLAAVYRQEHARLARDPAAGAALIDAIKGVRLPKDLDPAELASWFHLANILLNLDETITIG